MPQKAQTYWLTIYEFNCCISIFIKQHVHKKLLVFFHRYRVVLTHFAKTSLAQIPKLLS